MTETETLLTRVVERVETPWSPLFHVYEPWASGEPGLPPAGAVALCGYVRRSGAPGRTCSANDPDACVVCTALFKARHSV